MKATDEEIDALKKKLNGVYDENEELIRKNKKIYHTFYTVLFTDTNIGIRIINF